MTKRIFIYPYNQHSASAKALGFRRIKRENSRYRPRHTDVIINWGSSFVPENFHEAGDLLNIETSVRIAQNKTLCLQELEPSVNVVPFTTDRHEAERWLETGQRVFARTTLTGHSGAGIIDLYGRDVEPPQAPLYTKYIKKRYEFRVHVCDWSSEPIEFQRWGESRYRPCAILVTQKVARPGVEPANWHIRNHSNGFIFQEPNVPDAVMDSVTTEAHAAIQRLDLDFGAVDIIWNNHQQRAYVLEVNTAPGLTGRTVDFYRNAFERY